MPEVKSAANSKICKGSNTTRTLPDDDGSGTIAVFHCSRCLQSVPGQRKANGDWRIVFHRSDKPWPWHLHRRPDAQP